MFFEHCNTAQKPGRFPLCPAVTGTAHAVLDNGTLADFFYEYAFRCARLTTRPTADLIFRIGDTAVPDARGADYAIRVDERGAAVSADSERGLVRGYLTLLDMIQIDCTGVPYLPYCEVRESPAVALRMAHFCIFPETKLYELRRFLRLCGALKYTHVVLEFWGMLRYDCLPELGWPHAFTKEEIQPLLAEARALGVETVPMFNHWGHASGCRVSRGKHVVLCQNPALQALFDEHGWCWNIDNPRTLSLLRAVREELCALHGPGDYFHIGCDEAYRFSCTDENVARISRFINETAAELRTAGRKTILWGDMLLSHRPEYNPRNVYTAAAPDAAGEERMMRALSHDLIIADWQYDVREAPVETALTLQKAGFSTLLCPWDRRAACTDACVRTVREHHLGGILHTTWHTLRSGMAYVGRVAAQCWAPDGAAAGEGTGDLLRTAALLRRAFPPENYAQAGWAEKEVEADIR